MSDFHTFSYEEKKKFFEEHSVPGCFVGNDIVLCGGCEKITYLGGLCCYTCDRPFCDGCKTGCFKIYNDRNEKVPECDRCKIEKMKHCSLC